jgi:pSer/pThr/pTyr-binding forkhead associated (FHA) protein
MRKVLIHIDGPDGKQSVSLEDELTIGRTSLSNVVVNDEGLSRKNTTFFRDDEEILVVDEASLNGTFLNGELITGGPSSIHDGDRLKIGSSTTILIEIAYPNAVRGEPAALPTTAAPPPVPPPKSLPNANSQNVPTILIAVGAMTFVIVFGALVAILVVSGGDTTDSNSGPKPTPVVMNSGPIPMRVIDPLGGEDEDNLDDLIASWESEEKELDTGTVADVAATSSDKEDADLNVTAAFLADRERKSLEPRNAETGIRPAGLQVPKELFGDGVIKQKAKLTEMNSKGYHQPLDFAELADKRLKHELIEMPMATNSFYLAVGGSASEAPFSAFSFQTGNTEIATGTPKYQTLAQLAADYGGQKYDLNNPGDRKQMRIRLLRMFNQRAKPILQEVADAYYKKYDRPLRVTSLTRSMDYQIGLNATNANSFKVRGEGSLPPHTSGCAFDLARKHMTAEEQNFVMNKLAQMEDAGKLDALIEYGTNACFHIFIYFDGIAPKM